MHAYKQAPREHGAPLDVLSILPVGPAPHQDGYVCTTVGHAKLQDGAAAIKQHQMPGSPHSVNERDRQLGRIVQTLKQEEAVELIEVERVCS